LVLLHHKFKQISAKWGKQWGKHYPHFVAFFCIGKNNENAETLDNRAFGRMAVKTKTIKLDPSGPLKLLNFGKLFLFMAFYVYILQSEIDGSFYKGFTQDYALRLAQHNNGESIYTSTKMPWKLVYVEEQFSKYDAIKREKNLKKADRNRITALINSSKNLLLK